ncbi:MAG: M56 family metallopeptidase [Desulfitobacteriia bacterium]
MEAETFALKTGTEKVLTFMSYKIRQDMEVAADEKVLALLDTGEHKEYGKAQLTVLESFSLKTGLAPKLIGMVDDCKNMERRIVMIKMADFFRSKKRKIIFTGILCLVILGGVLWISGQKTPGNEAGQISGDTNYNPELLLNIFPEKYTPAMSVVPGLKIEAQYPGTADKVKYSVNQGNFLTGDSTSGNISQKGKTVELPLDLPVYWSSLENHSVKYRDSYEVPVTVTILNKDNIAAEKQLIIKYDGMFYSVLPGPGIIFAGDSVRAQGSGSLEEAVSLAIKERGEGYREGEVATEGHIIMGAEEKNGIVKAYTLASIAWFGFENGVFTSISGSGAIPTVITFQKNQNGEYSLLEYQEPLDGAGYRESIQKMFPQRLLDVIFEQDHYPALAKQQEEQAGEYLRSIGRMAKIQVSHVEKQLLKINTEASNKLFAVFTKNNQELNRFPYWIGTRECIMDGKRYIYETSQSKCTDGYDLVTFTKRQEDGTIVLEYQYTIIGSEPRLTSLQGYPEAEQ